MESFARLRLRKKCKLTLVLTLKTLSVLISSDIAGNLVDKLPLIIGKYGYDFVKKFYQDKVSMLVGDFSFTPVSMEHVLKILIGLNSNKATGLDGMPARFIIDSADIICKPFVILLIYLFSQESFLVN